MFGPKNDSNKLIDEITKDDLILKLDDLMVREELFKNPLIKSVEVAKKLNISVHQLSELLNTYLGENFSHLINERRIRHAIRLLESNPNYTIEAIGYQNGFNSKSTFYSAFKKVTGKLPSNYI